MKVLVIEDNPVLRDRIGRQFLKTAFVETASTGQQAFDKAFYETYRLRPAK